MHQILDRLFLGDLQDSINAPPDMWVINLSGTDYRRAKRYHCRHIPDEQSIVPGATIMRVVNLMRGYIGTGARVLIHCRGGVSRAPALAAAYLYTCGWDLEEAKIFVRIKRPIVDIHPAIWQSIRDWYGLGEVKE